MNTIQRVPTDRLLLTGFGMTLMVLLLVGGIALNTAAQSSTAVKLIEGSVIVLLAFLALLYVRILRVMRMRLASEYGSQAAQQPLLIAGALHDAILHSANFSSISTDTQCVGRGGGRGAGRGRGGRA